MASAGAIKAGEAYVEIGTRIGAAFEKGLKNASTKLRSFGAGLLKAGLAGVGALAAPVKLAADAEETMSKFEAVFKDGAAGAKTFGDALGNSIGRSKYQIADALSSFQAFFVGIGLGADRARELSQQMTATGFDLASFGNLADQDALDRFLSGLAGSSEVLMRFGINLTQATLQEAMLAKGITKSWSAMTVQEKVLLRVDEIMRSMGAQGAIGDAARTAGSFTNRMKALRGEMAETAVEIGNALLPGLTDVAKSLRATLGPIKEWIVANPEWVRTLGTVAVGVTAVGAAAVGLSFVLGGLSTAIKLAFGGAIIAGLVMLAEKIGIIDVGLSNFVEHVRVGGFQVSTWMAAIAIGMESAWIKSLTAMERAWNTFRARVLDVLPRKLFEWLGGADLGPMGPTGRMAGVTGGRLGPLSEEDLARRNAELDRSLAERLRALAAERSALFATDSEMLKKAAKIVEQTKTIAAAPTIGKPGKAMGSAVGSFSSRAAPLLIGTDSRMMRLNEQQLKTQQDAVRAALDIADSLDEVIGVLKARLPSLAVLGAP